MMTNRFGECTRCHAPIEDLGQTLDGGLAVLEPGPNDYGMGATVGGQLVLGGRLGGNVFDLAGCPTCRIFTIVGGYIERHLPHEVPTEWAQAWAETEARVADWTYRDDLRDWTTFRDEVPVTDARVVR